jgi:hypothetical protein
MNEYKVHLPELYSQQHEFVYDVIKRKVIRAGRRSGKTYGAAEIAVEGLLDHKRVLYAVPTFDQKEQFWYNVKNMLREPISARVYEKSETEHSIELPGTKARIRAKTAWNADSLRGDTADILILDEFQLMNEDTWIRVGAPMLLDNDGDAIFIYTPPSLHSRSSSKADDPRHASKLFKRAQMDTSGRWKTYTFSSHSNPHISVEALAEITKDMSSLAYRQEIEALDIDEAPGAQWTRAIIESNRVMQAPELDRIVVGVDPSITTGGDEAGIIVAGKRGDEYYVLYDNSIQGSPDTWAREAVTAYHRSSADRIIAEKNQGGEMVSLTINTVDGSVPVKLVSATRGKAIRAEPISALFEQGRGHMVGNFPQLEDELTMWTPGDKSPNRLDAMVWALTELSAVGEQDYTITYEDRVAISPY